MNNHQDKISNEAGETVKAGCVVVDGDKVLLIHNPDKTIYAFPKGHAKEGETAKEVALREVLEETGYKIEIVKKLSDITYTHGETGEPIRVNMFLAKLIEKISDDTEELWEWVKIEKAKGLMYPNQVPLLDEL